VTCYCIYSIAEAAEAAPVTVLTNTQGPASTTPISTCGRSCDRTTNIDRNSNNSFQSMFLNFALNQAQAIYARGYKKKHGKYSTMSGSVTRPTQVESVRLCLYFPAQAGAC
jgi:hypothetical protein